MLSFTAVPKVISKAKEEIEGGNQIRLHIKHLNRFIARFLILIAGFRESLQ